MAIADIAADSSFVGRRRYDLDWLRVIAFGLLIFYHIGMFYVTWGWHVKSVYAGPAAEPLMLLVNPWRLALLFFISGVAIRFATDKTPGRLKLVRSRLFRIGLPILVGMAVIVTPQAYFQLRYSGEIEPGYIAFWGDYLKLDQVFSITTPTWNHLWYVVYLLAYILLIAPFLPWMRQFAEGAGGRAMSFLFGGPLRLLLLAAAPFTGYALFLDPLFPTTHDLLNDWANHAHRLTMFLLGYFVAKHERFWASVDRALPYALALVLILGGGRLFLRAHDWDLYVSILRSPWGVGLVTLYAWSSISALMGLAQRYLNRSSKTLTYLTGAVFCYYILHQTIIVATGFYLTPLQLGAWPEFFILTSITVVGCGAGYEVLRRLPGVRPWFGIKSPPQVKKTPDAAQIMSA